MNTFKPHDIWGVIGLILFLIFVWYLLTNPKGTAKIIDSVFTGGNNTIKTLMQKPSTG